MPSGKVHDRITVATTILSLPVWWFVSGIVSPKGTTLDIPAYCAGVAAYLFSGFYLSDDLDTKCVALKRWGPLKFIWTPYQKLVPHRSWISHGICIGPILRVAYFLAALWLLARCALWLINQWIIPINRTALLTQLATQTLTAVHRHPVIAAWILGGLVLGGVAHTIADTFWSGLKRIW